MHILLAALGRPGPSATSVIVNYGTARPWADHRLIEARRLLQCLGIAAVRPLHLHSGVMNGKVTRRRTVGSIRGRDCRLLLWPELPDLDHVSLVARVLVYLIRQSLHGTDNCKRLRERRRIVNGESVLLRAPPMLGCIKFC